MKYLSSLLQAAVYTIITLFVIGVLFLASGQVENRWNPLAPLDLNDPPKAFEQIKLRRAMATFENCQAALRSGGVDFEVMSDLQSPDRPECGIQNRVELLGIGDIRMRPFETRCDMALRFAVWVKWDLASLAQSEGRSLSRIEHYGSYNCRTMRGSSRISKHASARAIDVSGFRFSNGEARNLKRDWGDSEFLRGARNSACKRFRLVLGPDYNALHNDHFHLQEGGGRGCR